MMHRALLVCSVLCVPAAAQLSRVMDERAATIDAYVQAATKQATDGNPEIASVLLRQAIDMAMQLHGADRRDPMVARIERTLAGIDPIAVRRRAAESEATDVLVEIAKSDAERGWLRAAILHGEFARSIAGRRAVDSVEAVFAAHRPAIADAMEVEIDWQDRRVVAGPDEWTVADGRVKTGELRNKNGTSMLLSSTALTSRVAVRADLTFNRHSIRAGFVFGYRSEDDYIAFEVTIHRKGRAGWIAKRRIPGTWKPLGNGAFTVKAGRGELVLPIAFDATADGLRAKIGDAEPVVVTPPEYGDVLQSGVFGVTAAATTGIDRYVEWENLRVTTVAPHPSWHPNADECVARARATAEAGDAEAAAVLLWSARSVNPAGEDAAARRNEIDTFLAEIDPNFDASLARCRAASEALRAVGLEYVAKGWRTTGVALLHAAARIGGQEAFDALRNAQADQGR